MHILIASRMALGGGLRVVAVFHLLISINMQQHVFPLQHATSPIVAAAFQSFHRLMLHLCVVRACPLHRPPIRPPITDHQRPAHHSEPPTARPLCVQAGRLLLLPLCCRLLLRVGSPIIINFAREFGYFVRLCLLTCFLV